MARRLAFIAFVTIVPVAVVVAAAIPIVTRSGWAKERAHEILTVQLAQSLDAEVRVGEIGGDVLTDLEIRDFAVSDGRSFADGTLLSVELAKVDLDLMRALRGDAPVVETIDEIRVVGLKTKLSRGTDGELNIQPILDLRKPATKPSKARFQGRIVIEAGELELQNAAPEPAMISGIGLRLINIDIVADFEDPRFIEYSAGVDGAIAPFDRIEADGRYALETQALSAHAALFGVDAATLAGRFAPSPAFSLRSGTVDVRGNVCWIPGELLDYTATGRIGGLSLTVVALQNETIRASSDFQITPAGIILDDLRAEAFGANIAGGGAIFDLSDPTLDVDATIQGLSVDRAIALAPGIEDQLPDMAGVDSVLLKAAVAGPISRPDIMVVGEFPDSVRVAYTLPESDDPEAGEPPTIRGTATGVSVEARIPDIETLEVELQVGMDELSVAGVDDLLPEQEYLRELTVAPLQDVTARLTYANGAPATTGRIELDRIDTEHGALEEITIDYGLVDRSARARVAVGNALGTEIEADGVIDFAGESLAVYADFDAAPIHLARVVPISGQELDVDGIVDASGTFALADGAFEVAAYVGGTDLRYEAIDITSAEANVWITPDAADVRYLTASSPYGTVAARGEYVFDGPITGEVTLADVPVDEVYRLAREMTPEDETEPTPEDEEKTPLTPAGTAFARLRLDGELKAPHVTADVAVLDPGVNEWTAEAATVSVDATPESVVVRDLLVRRGTVVASANGSLTEIAWPPGSFFSDEDPLPEGEEAPPLDASLRAEVSATGFELSQIGEFVEIPPDVRLVGLAQVTAEVSGSARSPHVGGALTVSDARVAHEAHNVSVGPMIVSAGFAAEPDEVSVSGLTVQLGDGLVAADALITELGSGEAPLLDAHFTATDIPINEYTPPQGLAGAIGGTVASLAGTVNGRLEAPWPTVEADIVATGLALGKRTLGDIDFYATFRDNTLAVTSSDIGVGDGKITNLSASYSPTDGRLFAGLEADRLSVREMVYWAGDFAAHGTGEGSADSRDRLYGMANRLEGDLSAEEILIHGPLDDVKGSVVKLGTSGVALDGRGIPDVRIDGRFSGLYLGEPPAPPSDTEQPVVATTGDGDPEEPRSATDRLHLDDVNISSEIGPGTLSVSGFAHFDDEMSVLAEVDLVRLDELAAWLPESLDLGGDLALTALAEGDSHDPKITASLEVFEPTFAGVVFDILQVTRIDVEETEIVMTGGLLKRDDNEVEAYGRLPFDRNHFAINRQGPVQFQANIMELPPGVVLELADEFMKHGAVGEPPAPIAPLIEAEGAITAQFSISGILAAPQIGGGLYVEPGSGARVRMASWPEDSAIEDISVDVVFDNSPTGEGALIDIHDVSGRFDNTTLALAGAIDLTHLSADELLRNRIANIAFTAASPRQALPGGLIAKNIDVLVTANTDEETGWHVVQVERGRADLGKGKITIGGHRPPGSDAQAGALLINSLDPRDLGHMPCDLEVVLTKAEAEIEPFITRSRLDGTIVARKFAASGPPLPRWFAARRLQSDRRDPGAPIRIASVAKGQPGQRGRIVVTRTSIGFEPPEKKEARPESEDAELPPAVEKEEEKRYYGLPRSLPAPDLDIAVEIGHHVALETSLLKGQIVPDRDAFRLTGTPQLPELQARFSLRRGSMRLLRGNLEIPDAGAEIRLRPMPLLTRAEPDRRELELTGPVWGRAEGTVSGTDMSGNAIGPIPVALELSGQLPAGLEVTTSSTPPMSESEVYALLALGPVRPGEGARTGDSLSHGEVIAQSIAKSIFSGVLRPLEEQLSDIFDLEQFELSVGVNQPVKFSVGKYIVRDLLVTYEHSAGGSDEEFDLRLSYDLEDRYQIQVGTNEDSGGEFTVNYQWTF